NCVIRNHTGTGLFFTSGGASSLAVSHTLVADNGGDAIDIAATGAGNVKATLGDVELYNNSFNGVLAVNLSGTATVQVAITDSVAAGNLQNGFIASSGTPLATAILALDHSVAANNGTGLFADGAAASVRVGQSTITGNTASWGFANNGNVRSY